MTDRKLIEGTPVLMVIDIQGGEAAAAATDGPSDTAHARL